jgi:hypothetical protein
MRIRLIIRSPNHALDNYVIAHEFKNRTRNLTKKGPKF